MRFVATKLTAHRYETSFGRFVSKMSVNSFSFLCKSDSTHPQNKRKRWAMSLSMWCFHCHLFAFVVRSQSVQTKREIGRLVQWIFIKCWFATSELNISPESETRCIVALTRSQRAIKLFKNLFFRRTVNGAALCRFSLPFLSPFIRLRRRSQRDGNPIFECRRSFVSNFHFVFPFRREDKTFFVCLFGSSLHLLQSGDVFARHSIPKWATVRSWCWSDVRKIVVSMHRRWVFSPLVDGAGESSQKFIGNF